MSLVRRILLSALLAGIALPCLAQNVTGNWKGKIVIDQTKVPKPKTPEQKKQFDQGMAMVKKMLISLSINANKTFSVSISNVPGQPGMTKKSTGTWKQQGSTVWLTATTEDGKPAKSKTPQQVKVAGGGRSLSMVPPGGMAQGISVVFTR